MDVLADETTGETGGEPCRTSCRLPAMAGIIKNVTAGTRISREAKQSRAQYDMLLYLILPTCASQLQSTRSRSPARQGYTSRNLAGRIESGGLAAAPESGAAVEAAPKVRAVNAVPVRLVRWR